MYFRYHQRLFIRYIFLVIKKSASFLSLFQIPCNFFNR